MRRMCAFMKEISLDYSTIGKRIRQGRQAMEKLAERVNISTSFVGHIERGEKLASLETVARICEALNVPLDYIVLGRRNDCARERCPLYLELVELTERYGNQP